jgi:hypothetical protein
MGRKKNEKVIQLFNETDQAYSAVEILAQYEPGPVYVLATETPEGPGIFLCDVPFTIEEAEAQHDFMSEQGDDLDDVEVPLETVEVDELE